MYEYITTEDVIKGILTIFKKGLKRNIQHDILHEKQSQRYFWKN